jgi:hypothetical protein
MQPEKVILDNYSYENYLYTRILDGISYNKNYEKYIKIMNKVDEEYGIRNNQRIINSLGYRTARNCNNENTIVKIIEYLTNFINIKYIEIAKGAMGNKYHNISIAIINMLNIVNFNCLGVELARHGQNIKTFVAILPYFKNMNFKKLMYHSFKDNKNLQFVEKLYMIVPKKNLGNLRTFARKALLYGHLNIFKINISFIPIHEIIYILEDWDSNLKVNVAEYMIERLRQFKKQPKHVKELVANVIRTIDYSPRIFKKVCENYAHEINLNEIIKESINNCENVDLIIEIANFKHSWLQLISHVVYKHLYHK